MISFVLPFFPPSTNHAFYVRHGRMHLSSKGKAFKESVTAHLVQNYMKELRLFKKNVPYFVYLRFFFEGGLENKGWNDLKRNGERKSETRYKVFDATNRVKLTEDALKDALGIDDSQFIAVLTHKMQGGPDVPEHIEVFIWDLEAERSPLDEFLRI
jgi:Holliday junction resolvase RusA-like endonuclease